MLTQSMVTDTEADAGPENTANSITSVRWIGIARTETNAMKGVAQGTAEKYYLQK